MSGVCGFDELWLAPGAAVPIDAKTVAILIDELNRMRHIYDCENETSKRLVREKWKLEDEIERLRSIAGKADVGQSFAELTSELRHQTPREPGPSGSLVDVGPIDMDPFGA